MANIGIQILGRRTGNFRESLDWEGSELVDNDWSASVESPFYYSAELKNDYSTYQICVCRFKGNDGRESVFHIGIRVPAGHIICRNNGVEVSPIEILDRLKNYFFDQGLLYNYGAVVKLKEEPLNLSILKPLIQDYTTMPIWGGSICMNASGPIVFVACTDNTIGRSMQKAELCPRLEPASLAIFSASFANVQTISLTPQELDAEPVIKVTIKRKDGQPENKVLGNLPLVINSNECGFSVTAYKNVSVSLSRQEVLSAAAHGAYYPAPAGAAVKIHPEQGTVTVEFSPEMNSETLRIDIEGIKSDKTKIQELRKIEQFVVTEDGSYKWAPLENNSVYLYGDSIAKFYECAADKSKLLQLFRIGTASDFILDSARLVGSTIYLCLKQKHQSKPLAGGKDRRPTTTNDSVLGNAVLNVSFPAKETYSPNLELEYNSGSAKVCLEIIPNYTYDNGKAKAEIPLPAIPDTVVIVKVDNPTRFTGTGCRTDNSNVYTVKISKEDRTSWWSKFSSAMAMNNKVSSNWYVTQIFVIILAFLLFFAAGLAIGVFQNDKIKEYIGIETTVADTNATNNNRQNEKSEAKATNHEPETNTSENKEPEEVVSNETGKTEITETEESVSPKVEETSGEPDDINATNAPSNQNKRNGTSITDRNKQENG